MAISIKPKTAKAQGLTASTTAKDKTLAKVSFVSRGTSGSVLTLKLTALSGAYIHFDN
ncbi:unnamed protein product, partial [marine sediment metagenome]